MWHRGENDGACSARGSCDRRKRGWLGNKPAEDTCRKASVASGVVVAYFMREEHRRPLSRLVFPVHPRIFSELLLYMAQLFWAAKPESGTGGAAERRSGGAMKIVDREAARKKRVRRVFTLVCFRTIRGARVGLTSLSITFLLVM